MREHSIADISHVPLSAEEKLLSASAVTSASRRRDKLIQRRDEKIGRGPIRDEEAEDFLEPYEIGRWE